MVLLRIKNTMITVIILSGLLGIIYISKPDRGGLGRCQEIFGFDTLSQRGLEILPFSAWSPFENSKFRMKIQKSKFESLKIYLYGHGYETWEAGGLQFGSLNIGWDGLVHLQYSIRKFDGHVHIVAYDQTNRTFYTIVSQ
jgi:hypothetical protein